MKIPGTKLVRAGSLPYRFVIPSLYHAAGRARAIPVGHRVRVTFLGHSVLLNRSARVRAGAHGRDIERWLRPALLHAEADEELRRPWQCMCGHCRQARIALGSHEAGRLTSFAIRAWVAARVVAYNRAVRT